VTCYPFYFVGDAPQRYIVRAQVRPDLSTVTASR
jgi:sortase (surface protein transpeptidase)